jgi:hypothetical protein
MTLARRTLRPVDPGFVGAAAHSPFFLRPPNQGVASPSGSSNSLDDARLTRSARTERPIVRSSAAPFCSERGEPVARVWHRQGFGSVGVQGTDGRGRAGGAARLARASHIAIVADAARATQWAIGPGRD